MTKFMSFTFGAALLAAASFSSAVLAQSVNLQFGGPLGNFTAQRNQPGTAGTSGPRSGYDQSDAERRAARARAETAARERARLLAAKNSGGGSTTVKSDDTPSNVTSTTPAAPTIVVPPSPPVAATPATPENASTAVVETSSEPATKSAPVVAADPPIAAAPAATSTPETSDSKKVCRKYSAVVDSVIEVPCD
jgi:hypothetical protein